MEPPKSAQLLGEFARELGFIEARVIKAAKPSREYRKHYIQWLRGQALGKQRYLKRVHLKFNPKRIFTGVRSIIVLLAPYYHSENNAMLRQSQYKVARYAHGRDYHKVLKKKGEKLIKDLQLSGRCIVDSAPFPERYFARLSGIGKIGRNGLLIHRDQGSYNFLAFILTADEFSSYQIDTLSSLEHEVTSTCKTCSRCVDACPTTALKGDGTLSLNRCLATITIEEPVTELRIQNEKKHRWIFGCDICQQVCPYNITLKDTEIDDFKILGSTSKLMQGQLGTMNDADLYGSALKRAGVEKLQANINRLFV